MRKDRFGEIAAEYHVDPARGLVNPKPQAIASKEVELIPGTEGSFAPFHKSQNREELYAELEEKRREYRKFLQNYAPPAELREEWIPVKQFVYSLNGGSRETVSIPHYRGPVGRHTAVYETAVSLPPAMGRRVILAFGGVDYKAEIYVNDVYAFSHEGFFAPFSGDVTDLIHAGENRLRIVVKNDYKMMGEDEAGGRITGDKIYAATGPGWDEPQEGWHHCPAGMGIYNYVRFELKEKEYITDIFPRIYGKDGEVWVECQGTDLEEKEAGLLISIYGRNFKETVIEDAVCVPCTNIEVGVGDSYTLAELNASGRLGTGISLKLGNGFNRFKIPVHIDNPRIWTLENPWLYQIQIKLMVDRHIVSVAEEHFGIREFRQDTEEIPRGTFFLNGEEIELRGANTMGFEQQDVMQGNLEQLIDDILLAKLCNMNFMRITQRPVQREIYDYCDMLGLMVQTDLPLFGVVRINQYCEVLRQAEEMEKLIRSHPSCVLVSYINERFPNANNSPHRMLEREDLEGLFESLNRVVRLHNPDRVVKYVDGDFDPPTATMPDSHCYTLWYNGHGIDVGRLNKGYWLSVKPQWRCGCGEFGAEGLDYPQFMYRRYPAEWRRQPFRPENIPGAQSGTYHYMFYETPHSMEEWIEDSQRHQEFAIRLMASSMRRNPLVNLFAVHLFIDAFPAGWMKTIMDCERTPKPAYFAYRECLAKVFCDIRTDRYKFFAEERVSFDTYLCDDSHEAEELSYFVFWRGRVICAKTTEVIGGVSQGRMCFSMPKTAGREPVTVYMGALCKGKVLNYTKLELEVFPAEKLLDVHPVTFQEYDKRREYYEEMVEQGGKVVVTGLPEGECQLFGKSVKVTACRMNPLYAVSRDTGHPYVSEFRKNDFAYWYDSEKDMLAPIISATFECEDAEQILTAGNQIGNAAWQSYCAAAQFSYGNGNVILCQLDMEHKEKNPVFVRFWNRIFET